MSELQDVVQVVCINCSSAINSLMIGEQSLEIICEGCLDYQTKQNIRLTLEMDILEKAIKQIKSSSSQIQQSALHKKLQQNENTQLERRNMERVRMEQMEMEKRIKQQKMKNLHLYKQLIKVEQKEQEAQMNFYKQSQQLNVIYGKLTHEKAMLAQFNAYQQMLKGFKLNFGIRQISR